MVAHRRCDYLLEECLMQWLDFISRSYPISVYLDFMNATPENAKISLQEAGPENDDFAIERTLFLLLDVWDID